MNITEAAASGLFIWGWSFLVQPWPGSILMIKSDVDALTAQQVQLPAEEDSPVGTLELGVICEPTPE